MVIFTSVHDYLSQMLTFNVSMNMNNEVAFRCIYTLLNAGHEVIQPAITHANIIVIL